MTPSASDDFVDLPLAHGTGQPAVPVFDCRVFVSPADDRGHVSLRCVNVPEMIVEAANERDGLREIVRQFKELAAREHAAGRSVPAADPAVKPVAGEQERWIPVHL